MSQKISRRTRRRRQATRESWSEVERRQIAQANWSGFDCVNPVRTSEQPFRSYCWPGCNPKPGEFACACTCRMLDLIEQRPFRALWPAKD